MICAIITPVGPGHEALLRDSCAPSVAQARDWNMGPFTEVRHLVMDDSRGLHGRSCRRNDGLAEAQAIGAEWVFFLDADDILAPNAFDAFGRIIAREPDLHAVWGLICTLDDAGEPALRDDQPETLSSRAEFLSVPPYLAVQIGGFYRTDAAAAAGFDSTRDVGEDYQFYTGLWAEYPCAKRPEIFFINRRGQHSTGPRSATGQQWSETVTRLWRAQLRTLPVWARIEDGKAPPLRMRLSDPADAAQLAHAKGTYFEPQSLEKLRALVRRARPHVVDVGARAGNHIVWSARQLEAARLYPVAPDPEAVAHLDANIEANALVGRVDRRGMGPAGRGALDALMGGDRVDVIKIEAQAHPLRVLEGARDLIARDRPVIWAEVARSDILRFVQDWCRSAGYRVADSAAHSDTVDYFAVPKE